MYWNRIIIVLFIVLFGTYQTQAKDIHFEEDRLIFMGLVFDEYQYYKQSCETYRKLYDLTNEEKFLFRAVKASIFGQVDLYSSLESLKTLEKDAKDGIEVQKLLIGIYLSLNQMKEAQKVSQSLLKTSSSVDVLHLCANAYFFGGDMIEALKIFKQVYEKVPDEDILLKIVMILDTYRYDTQKAIKLLHTHTLFSKKVSPKVYLKLLELYKKTKNTKGILETYKRLYLQTKEEKYLLLLIDKYRYIKRLKEVIPFLEAQAPHSIYLYEIYKVTYDFSKAITLAKTFYQQDANAKWISEQAMLMVELYMQNRDKNMVKEALKAFEKSIALGSNDSLYLNYYGYTLIDEELDISKGIKMIKDALLQEPHNSYYLDSLAWGYYKDKQCDEARDVMRKVVQKEGLDIKEIKHHWTAIAQCK